MTTKYIIIENKLRVYNDSVSVKTFSILDFLERMYPYLLWGTDSADPSPCWGFSWPSPWARCFLCAALSSFSVQCLCYFLWSCFLSRPAHMCTLQTPNLNWIKFRPSSAQLRLRGWKLQKTWSIYSEIVEGTGLVFNIKRVFTRNNLKLNHHYRIILIWFFKLIDFNRSSTHRGCLIFARPFFVVIFAHPPSLSWGCFIYQNEGNWTFPIT